MDLSPPGERRWKCNQCESAFARPDHLRRHSLTHNTKRSHVCHFCGALFSRGDVLRRHWKSCKIRLEQGQEMPESNRGGKHKQSCDSCASIRKACNRENPCSECIHRGRPCTYQRLYKDTDIRGSPLDTDIPMDPETHEAPDTEMEVDVPNREQGWSLGPQNFYPSTVPIGKLVYSRNRYGT